jgi:hypothetical protein
MIVRRASRLFRAEASKLMVYIYGGGENGEKKRAVGIIWAWNLPRSGQPRCPGVAIDCRQFALRQKKRALAGKGKTASNPGAKTK